MTEAGHVFILLDAQERLWLKTNSDAKESQPESHDPTRLPDPGEQAPEKNKTKASLDSHVVPHRSTDRPQRCLVSEIGRDRTFSPWYEPTMETNPLLRLQVEPSTKRIKSKRSPPTIPAWSPTAVLGWPKGA